jgi:hypothetical protein
LFSSLWPIKENPEEQIFREVHEPVDGSSGYEEEIAWPNLLPHAVVQEFAVSLHYNVDFVTRMRLLRVDIPRRKNLHDKASVLKHLRKRLALWTWQAPKRFDNRNAVMMRGLILHLAWHPQSVNCLAS